MQRIRKRPEIRETIVFLFSNLRQMDWIEAVISDLSKDYEIFILALYPEEQEWLEGMRSPSTTINVVRFCKPNNIFRAVIDLHRVLGITKSRIVVAHGFYASIAAVVAGKIRLLTRVITVRHHGRGHYENFLLNGLDRFISNYSNKIIAISELTKRLLLSEGVGANKIIVLPNAIDVDKFYCVPNKPRDVVLSEFGFDDSNFVIGVISRFVDWKGIRFIIEAFVQILETNPEARLVLANSNRGNSSLEELLAKIDQKFIFRIDDVGDIPSFYRSLDVFVHTPISFDAEPFGLVYLEGLASGTNCVFTKSGVIHDLREIERYAWLVDFNSSEEIECSIRSVIEGGNKEKISLEYLADFTIETYVRNFRKFVFDVL